ncbi:barttin isoform X2 [Denticeps clupeoides]|uniref:barttin isoform X2 n=1 Tax=Denticeps clupeoides TaxID=299321 RepID=UPI0010A2D520|nr:barttin isoform X2 [Denticeps clupeoides]
MMTIFILAGFTLLSTFWSRYVHVAVMTRGPQIGRGGLKFSVWPRNDLLSATSGTGSSCLLSVVNPSRRRTHMTGRDLWDVPFLLQVTFISPSQEQFQVTEDKGLQAGTSPPHARDGPSDQIKAPLAEFTEDVPDTPTLPSGVRRESPTAPNGSSTPIPATPRLESEPDLYYGRVEDSCYISDLLDSDSECEKTQSGRS